MQFLLMCCFDESRWASLPAAKRDQIMSEYGQYVRELKQSGRLLGGAKLEACASAVTVRERSGKPLTTDGPFAETKEQMGGYHVIECANREEALAIARGIPTLPAGGAVEVRPIEFAE